MNRNNYELYIMGSIKLGIGFGIVSLLARWVTGNTILSAPETLIKYGLVGGIGYSLMGALALISFGLLAKRIREKFPMQQTIGDVLRQKLTPTGYWCMIFILVLTGMYSLFIQATGVGMLIHIIFPIPVFIGMFLFLGFCFLIGGIGGLQRIHQLSGIAVLLTFCAVIVIPVYFYIQEGVHPVFDGMKLYHPYVFFFKNTDAIWFIFTGIIVGLGQVITDRATWQRIFVIQKEKVQMTFILTGLIWATIPLALSSLLMIIISGRSYENIFSLVIELVDKIQTTVLIILFVLFCFCAILSAMSSELHSLTTLLVKNVMELFQPLTNRDKWKYTYIFSIIICGLLLAAVCILPPSPVELLFFFGNIYAALIFPMIYIILSTRKLPAIIPLSSLIGTVGGFLALPITDNLISIWISLLISGCICIVVLLSNTTRNRLKI